MMQYRQLSYMYCKQEQDGCPGCRAILSTIFGVCGKVLAVEGCHGRLCKKKQGLPCIRYSWFQLIPSSFNGLTIGHS